MAATGPVCGAGGRTAPGYASSVRSAAALLILSVVVSALLAACGGSADSESLPAGSGPTLEQLAERPGPDVALVAGTQDHARGPVRFSFLVLDRAGRPVDRPRARVWIASDRASAPFLETSARLQPVGVPGGYKDDLGVTHLYVANVRIPEDGKFWVLAEPVGARIQGLGNLVVKEEAAAPAVGSKAFPSRTPTLGDAPVGELTTRVPPDRELLRYSVAESLRAKKPFVVTFATPKFCSSRTCGPVVDVVDRVRRDLRGTDVRFIHVEIYERNEPALGVNEWVEEWRLPSEPFTFLVGRDGRIAAKFEGSMSVVELRAAVRRHLLRR